MVFAFFDSRGMIYTRYAPIGKKVNAAYIVEVLGAFYKMFKRKRPELAEREWFFHCLLYTSDAADE